MRILIIFILLIILYLLYRKEDFVTLPFENIDDYYRINYNNKDELEETSVYDNRFKFITVSNNDKKLDTNNSLVIKGYETIKSTKCCKVKRGYNNYEYEKYQDEACDITNFELNHESQVLYDGLNGWSNEKCSVDNSDLGSCRRYDFECMDFISKEKCDEYNQQITPDRQNRNIYFEWFDKPCTAKYVKSMTVPEQPKII
jgi:hypothetical protein